MTEQAGDQAAAEAQWAGSGAGRAAVDAASGKLAEIDPDGDWQVGGEHITAIAYAAHAAYTEALAGSEPEDPPAAGDGQPGHEHDWRFFEVQEAPPEFAVPGIRLVLRTAVLTRCAGCGEPRAWLLPGDWTRADFGDPLFRR
jgi:hypothetical protein